MNKSDFFKWTLVALIGVFAGIILSQLCKLTSPVWSILISTVFLIVVVLLSRVTFTKKHIRAISLLFCEEIEKDPKDQRISIFKTFDGIRAEGFPCTRSMAVIGFLHAPKKGKHEFMLQIHHEDGKRTDHPETISLEIPEENTYGFVAFSISNFYAKKPETCIFRVICDGKPYAERSLKISL